MKYLHKNDAIILLEDGVYLGIEKNWHNLAKLKSHSVYALSKDVKARGINSQLSTRIKLIEDHEFVKLTIKYPKFQAWY